MKKTMTLLVAVSAVVAAVGLAIVPAMTYTASAATASVGAFASNDFAAATGTASVTGFSGSSAGIIALCPDFAAFGACSESTP